MSETAGEERKSDGESEYVLLWSRQEAICPDILHFICVYNLMFNS